VCKSGFLALVDQNCEIKSSVIIVVYLTSSCVNWGFFGTSAKKAQLTHEQVEYVFLFDEPLKESKSLKIFKISLTFRFDKW
jgi:hypothetical protein